MYCLCLSRYYKQSGYFGDRHISLEDYLKWEDWWYQYRDWLKKYGATDAGVPEVGGGYDRGRIAQRWPEVTDGREGRKRRRY